MSPVEGSPAKPEDYPHFMSIAHDQALKSRSEGGIPIGAALVHLPTSRIISRGHNNRVQLSSNVRHGEMDCLENLGRVPEGLLRECAMFTTLSPCIMCSATCILYKIPTVVLAENENFLGGEQLLRDNGVNVINLDSDEIKKMMKDWINSPGGKVWNEDIGEVTQS
ncbi:cytosine deaminase [Cryptococcus deuterogattii 99/473]|uniref:Cytosine deaminase n=1 Tax=Cryptococcus deuterogattii Ram5 TaxID=1296110 RepID=A0A0D0V4P3_9TREE|nr:cytosine deaminase [Cryptococcus deuterogattii Ram5]KIS00463.1 cytosine deaminase [Cryptococcus deuterogattii 2001/935-1]KIY59775.1 cytosine deaminase [Cryptococcus deuterogattii 99/473]